MLQLMQDVCKVDLDTCISYLELGDDKHSELFKDINQLVDVIIKTGL